MSKLSSSLNSVFGHEMNLIASRKHDLKHHVSLTVGYDEYEALLAEYEKLFKVSKKISVISDVQGRMLKQRETDIRNLLDHANQGFMTFGSDLKINDQYSKQCTTIFGSSVAGAYIPDLLCGVSKEAQQSMRRRLSAVFSEGRTAESCAELLRGLPAEVDVGRNRIALEYKAIDSGEPMDELLIMVIVTDITEQVAAEERIRYLSSRDTLTSLYNRNYIEPLLNQAVTEDQLPLSMLVFDLNGLKLANDVFGHHIGDQMLVKTARLLQSVMGEEAAVARWGGDEFIALLPKTGATACRSLAERLKAACMSSSVEPVRLSMAVGSATLTRTGETLHQAFAFAEKEMYKNKLLESKQVRIEMMDNVAESLLRKAVVRAEHFQRLHQLTDQFASQLADAPRSYDRMLIQSLIRFHDIGYLALPADILLKPAPLDDEEWKIVKGHSEIGYRMASSIGEWALAEAILGMHERWDGGGYPYGLASEQIPYVSRLLAILDAFDVMTHDQVYKRAVTVEGALQTIDDEAGKQFDPELAGAFVNWMRGYSKD